MRPLRLASVACTAWTLLTSGTALADSSLSASAAALAHELGAPSPHVLVAASPLTSDVVAPRGNELAVRMAALVASALGAGADASPVAMTLAEARGRRAARLLYLDVRVGNGELRVTGDVYPGAQNAWDRARGVIATPLAHAYVHSPVTAEIRAYLAPVHLEREHAQTFTHGMGPLLALACGALDGAGGNDLVLVSEREVAWGYLARGRFVPVKRVASRAIGPRAPVPFREPIAFADVVPSDARGALYVAWGDRRGAKLGPDLVAGAPLTGLPVAFGGGAACFAARAALGGFEGGLVGCEDGRPVEGASSTVESVKDAWRALDLVGVDGKGSRVMAARDVTGTLHLLRTEPADTRLVPDVGAALALADLDQDGVPEVVTTLPSMSGEDAIVVSSWKPASGSLEPRLRIVAPRGVEALTVCPGESDGAPSLVAAVAGEIWLVH